MNDWERQHRQAQRYKEAYPPGTRLMLLSMNDPHHPVESGTRGTVEHVDDMGTIHMKWDNGRGLGLVPGEDEFRRLTQEEIDEELREQAQEQTPQEQSIVKRPLFVKLLILKSHFRFVFSIIILKTNKANC